jgi:hypothetical protein
MSGLPRRELAAGNLHSPAGGSPALQGDDIAIAAAQRDAMHPPDWRFQTQLRWCFFAMVPL